MIWIIEFRTGNDAEWEPYPAAYRVRGEARTEQCHSRFDFVQTRIRKYVRAEK
jgi:hypothetical protein